MSTHRDGNAIAGLLAAQLGVEVTTATRRCGSCGDVSPFGAHPVHEGAGVVVRCPACGDVAAVLTPQRDGYRVRLEGGWIFRT